MSRGEEALDAGVACERRACRFRAAARAAGIATAAVGAAVLTGWALDVAALKSVLPNTVTMKANTALAFVLAGLALLVLRETPPPSRAARGLARGCGAIVGAIGLLTLVEYGCGLDLGIDQLLVRESATAVATSNPGRMAPNTALNFLLLGLAILLMDRETRRGFRPTEPLAVIVGCIGFTAFTGYLYGVRVLTGFGRYTLMAVHTSVVFMVVAAGLLCARPARGWMALANDNGVAGLLVRWLIPGLAAIMTGLGELRMLGERTGVFTSAVGTSLFNVIRVVVLGITVYLVARLVQRLERVRDQAEASLRQLNADLERRVAERTAEVSRLNADLERRVAERTAELESARARLEVSNQDLEQFAYVASHDLQEPLRKISAFGSLLEKEAGPSLHAEARDYVDRMLNAAKRMQALINDLLALSRVTSRARPPAPVDLNQTLRDVLADLEPRIAAARAHVTVGPLPTVEGDPLQLHQLFQNLVGNAIKFHREDAAPEVGVLARTSCSLPAAGPDDTCELVVRDNGIGFDDKYADRIFGIFQRLHSRGVYDGTGIGLAVCRKIAHRHGGSIAAHGRPGEGAEFVVRLPCRRARDAEGGGETV